jgi:hypothetical protein
MDNELRVHPVTRLITDLAAAPRRIVKSSPMLLRLAGPAYPAKSIALGHVARKGSISEFSEGTWLDTISFDSLQAFQQWETSDAELIASRLLRRYSIGRSSSTPRGRAGMGIPGRSLPHPAGGAIRSRSTSTPQTSRSQTLTIQSMCSGRR